VKGANAGAVRAVHAHVGVGKRVPSGDSAIDRTDGDDAGVVADDFLVCWLEIKGARKVVRKIDEKV
jgi:hypothetical protein